MNLDDWNKAGRAKNTRVCDAFREIIEEDGGSDEDFTEDKRGKKLAEAVLAEVVALKGDSYRLKDRDLGRVPRSPTEEP